MGKLIVIEGSDGSGKATQAAMLFERLKNEGYKVRLITFPNYDSPSSDLVKLYLNGKFGEKVKETNIYAISTFYAMDRFASYQMDWKEFYEDGGIVISDRYTTSNMIHQGSRANCLASYIDWVKDSEYVKYSLPKPDMVFFLDVPPEVSEKLMTGRPNKITNELEKDIHEKDKQFLMKSYETAKIVSDMNNWTVICCSLHGKMRTRENIAKDLYSNVKTSNLI